MASRSTEIVDARRPPFFWIANSAKQTIRRLERKDQPYAVAVYSALAYAASVNRDGVHAGFRATRREIADEAGMTSKTLDRYVLLLEELGLLRVIRERTEEGMNLPNRWVLLDGAPLVHGGESDDPTPAEQPHPPDSDIPPVGIPNDPPLEEGLRNAVAGPKEEVEMRDPRTFGFSPTVATLCHLMADLQNERLGEVRYKVKPCWLTDMDRMLRIDERKPAHVEAAIRWVHRHDFWGSNILSPGKLREQYDRLALEAKRNGNGNGRADDLAARNARRRALFTKGNT